MLIYMLHKQDTNGETMSRRPPIVVSIYNAESSSISVKVEALDPHGCMLRWVETDGTRVNSAVETPRESVVDWIWAWFLPTPPRNSIDISVAPSSEGVVWTDSQWPPRIHVTCVGGRTISRLLEDTNRVHWKEGRLFDASIMHSRHIDS